MEHHHALYVNQCKASINGLFSVAILVYHWCTGGQRQFDQIYVEGNEKPWDIN